MAKVYGESKSVYPEHKTQPIVNFIAQTFLRDGVKCFYGVERGNFSTSKSNMSLDEFREINKGKPIERKYRQTNETYNKTSQTNDC